MLRSAALLAKASGLLRWSRRPRVEPRLSILEYHEVVDSEQADEGCVTARRFEEHLDLLCRRYRVVSLSEGLRQLNESGRDATRPMVAITFDDGYLGNATCAWPRLEQYGVTGTFFVAVGFVDGEPLWFEVVRACLASCADGRLDQVLAALETKVAAPFDEQAADRVVERLKTSSNGTRRRIVDEIVGAVEIDGSRLSRPMSWEQIRSMAAAGADIGGHTLSHPILSRQSVSEQKQEIAGSRSRLQDELNEPPRFFAYPNGSTRDFDEDSVRLVAAEGFEGSCTTVRGSNAPGCDPFRLRRVGIADEPASVLDLRLSGLVDRFYGSQSTGLPARASQVGARTEVAA